MREEGQGAREETTGALLHAPRSACPIPLKLIAGEDVAFELVGSQTSSKSAVPMRWEARRVR
jgi:hypothetical protein